MPKLDLATLKQRGAMLLDGFTRGQKTMLALAVVATLVGGFLFTRWSAAPDYSALYSNLSAKDAADVTQHLTSSGVKYRLGAGGSTILVPRKDVYQLRLDLSSQGLPSTGQPGYSLLDKQGITTSEFRQRVDYQRALEGELSNTISAIKGVSGATVHIVIPKDDLFSQDASKPTASVLVQNAGGNHLSSGQVNAIVHLVASSVEGLDPANVTVADGEGHVLSAPGTDGAAAGDARAEQTATFEQQVSDSITQLLVPLVGQGHAVVRVKAALNFDATQTTRESYGAPTSAVPVNEQTSKETYNNAAGNPASGVLGGNTTTGPQQAGNYNKETADRAFAVPKVVEQVTSPPGKLERLSVAVLLDSGAKAVNVQSVQSLVAAAAGIDTTRGDTVKVDALKFDTTSAEQAKKALASQQSAKQTSQLIGLARTLGSLLLVLLVLFFAFRSARKATVHRVPLALPPAIELGPMPVPVGELTPQPAASVAPPKPVELAAPPKELLSDQLVDMIDQQPEDVAQMLRGWLADRRG